MGTTISCPSCQTAVTVPTLLLLHRCPQCRTPIKSAAEMKGEDVDCPGCGKEFAVPGTPESAAAPPSVGYICPVCHAEVEAPEQTPDQTSRCPSCEAQVHFRRKLHLKPPSPGLALLPERQRWGRVAALVILVFFAGLIAVVFLKIKTALQ